ncbi:hypothetical protein FOZ63_003308, partial [Perkinsus olseni]
HVVYDTVTMESDFFGTQSPAYSGSTPTRLERINDVGCVVLLDQHLFLTDYYVQMAACTLGPQAAVEQGVENGRLSFITTIDLSFRVCSGDLSISNDYVLTPATHFACVNYDMGVDARMDRIFNYNSSLEAGFRMSFDMNTVGNNVHSWHGIAVTEVDVWNGVSKVSNTFVFLNKSLPLKRRRWVVGQQACGARLKRSRAPRASLACAKVPQRVAGSKATHRL